MRYARSALPFGFVDAASSPSDKKIVAHPMFIGRRRRGRIPLYPTISRHIPVYPGISRILFFVRGHPGGAASWPWLVLTSVDDAFEGYWEQASGGRIEHAPKLRLVRVA